jgi:hypothetical protein
MAAGDKIIIPAQAAGFASLFGHIEKGSGDTLNLPEGMLNIGGNGKGYLTSQETDWDPFDAANNDGSFSSVTLGDDIYIYACQDASGTAKWIASKNTTVPTGYTAGDSRKVGGFHVGRYRGIANRYDTAYNPPTQIIPNSCWDIQHRPTCDPTGMVEIVPGSLWADIYLNSEGVGTWPENIPVSKYGATLIRDNIYSRSDFHQLINNAGKRLPTPEEFLRYAEGAPQGSDTDNNTAWSDASNTGPTTAGGVAKAVSQHNIVDAAGNLWEWLDAHYDLGLENTVGWVEDIVNVGKDETIPRGSMFTYLYGTSTSSWRSFCGGGYWHYGVHCGSRCLNSAAHPWVSDGAVGLRGVCDAL